MRNVNKVYTGERLRPEEGTLGGARVLVDGEPLRHVVVHSPSGFNWGYGGSGPADLAYAILLDYLGDERLASQLYQDFKWEFIASLDQRKSWAISGAEIEAWLRRKGIRESGQN